MLTRLVLKDLTVFPEAEFAFASGLNVVVGENGTGKSHFLKAAYTVAAISARGEKDSGLPTPMKSHLEMAVAKTLRGVFPAGRTGTVDALQEELSQSDRYSEAEATLP